MPILAARGGAGPGHECGQDDPSGRDKGAQRDCRVQHETGRLIPQADTMRARPFDPHGLEAGINREHGFFRAIADSRQPAGVEGSSDHQVACALMFDRRR